METIMAYTIHITAANGWWQSEENPIPLEKLKELVTGGNEGVSGVNPDTRQTITIGTDYSFQWPLGDQEPKYHFHYMSGRVVFKHISDEQIKVAKDLASKLGAIVQGDEEEIY